MFGSNKLYLVPQLSVKCLPYSGIDGDREPEGQGLEWTAIHK